jgi:hypothetical protein
MPPDLEGFPAALARASQEIAVASALSNHMSANLGHAAASGAPPGLLALSLLISGIARGNRSEGSQPVAAPQQLMSARVLRQCQIGLLTHTTGPRYQLTGTVALDQFASRPPLVLGRDGMRDQAPPSIICVDLEAAPMGLDGPPSCRSGLNGLSRYSKQSLILGVPQREAASMEIEDAEMADRRPSPVHDVHDRRESAHLESICPGR